MKYIVGEGELSSLPSTFSLKEPCYQPTARN
jgi:hypothetical protein